MYKIEKLFFYSDNQKLEARLYRTNQDKRPIILMGHGFAAEMDYGLHPFAEEFVKFGFNVFMFNYRGFGESEGKIRQLVDHRKHIEDIQNAIKFIKTIDSIDSYKIILWGTSYGGGHVLTVASNNKSISAVIAQVPFVDGIATITHLPLKNILLGGFYGVIDILYSFIGKTYYIPVVSTPNKFAAMNTKESYEGYLKLVPLEKRNNNYCPARISFTLPLYRPIRYVKRIQCPVLIIAAENDSLIPINAIKRTAKKIQNVKLQIFACGHFDVYDGAIFYQNIEVQKNFLLKYFNK